MCIEFNVASPFLTDSCDRRREFAPIARGKLPDAVELEAVEFLDYRAAIKFLEALDDDDSKLLDLALKLR